MKSIFQCHFQILWELGRMHCHPNSYFIFVLLQVHFPLFSALLYGRDGTDSYRGLLCFLSLSQNPVTAMRTNTSLPAGRSKSCGREPSRFREAILDQLSSQPPAEGRCLNKPSHGQNIWAKVTIIDQLNQTQEKFILKGGCLNWLSLRVFGYFLIQQKLHNPY